MANILIIEDNQTLNQAYRLILEKAGHTVTSAYNGREGLKATEKSDPDIILLDMLMPEMDGLEFLRHYKPQKTGKAGVVILSNLDEDREVKEALRLGAARYILKASTSPSELAVRVNHLIRKLTRPSSASK